MNDISTKILGTIFITIWGVEQVMCHAETTEKDCALLTHQRQKTEIVYAKSILTGVMGPPERKSPKGPQ